MTLEPTLQKFLSSIKQISLRKAPVKDTIPPEFYKYGGKKLAKSYTDSSK